MSEYGFWHLAQQDPAHLALVTPDGREITARALLARANQLVHGLRGLGLDTGDVVAAVLPNGAPMIECYLGALQAGLYLVPVNHHLTASEIAYIVRDSGAKAFVADERFAGACADAADEARVAPAGRLAVGKVPGFRPYDGLLAAQPPTLPGNRTAGAVMNYTSGTTGRPKGVRRPLAPVDPDLLGTFFSMFLGMFGIQPHADNVHLCGSPLYHTAPLTFTGCSLHLGHTVVLMDKWTPELHLQACARYRVTTSHMVPTQFHRLLALPDEVKARYDLSSLRHMIHAAAPCPIDVKRRMLAWWGPVIYEYYAASEGGGTLVGPREWLERPGTVGRAWPGAEIRIYDDAGTVLPSGQVGTVYMALANQSFEYHGDQEKTEANRRDGFFTVGDVGLLDEEGYLFLRDRKIDMIIAGGANIYPAEIESVLLTHPKVGDCAVFGIPHEDWGEEVKAVIEPAEGVAAGPALADEIMAFCQERLAKYKCPRSIDFLEQLPRDPNGKLYKRKLRDPYWAGRERAI